MEALLLILLIVVVYFAPTIIATVRKKRNKDAIFLLNLLLGWTFIGWVVALVWSVMYEAPMQGSPNSGRVSRLTRPCPLCNRAIPTNKPSCEHCDYVF